MKEETREKMRSLEQEISQEKGNFLLFGLFLRTDAQDKWDLLVSAPWLEKDKKSGLEFLIKRIDSMLDSEEILAISRIVVLEQGDPVLEAINKAISVQHGKVEVADSTFSGVEIAQAVISTSSRPDTVTKKMGTH